MKKDTFYFPHDYNTRSDPKVKLLLFKHGMTGLGIFWSIIEDLYCNSNELPMHYESIAYDLRVDVKIVESILNDFDLFKIHQGYIKSESVQRRLDERKEKSLKASESIKKRWDKPKDDSNVLPSNNDSNTIKESKEKENKEKENKISNPVSSPDGDTNNMKDLNSGLPPKPPAEKAPPVAPPPPPEKELKFNLVHNEKTGTVTCSVLRKMIVEFQNAHPGLYKDDMYKDFLMHWSMPNQKGKPKWRVETDRKNGVFHIGGRLATWNNNDFGKTKPGNGRTSTLRPTSIAQPSKLTGAGTVANVEL